MKTARQADSVTWWNMGRAAKAKGMDIEQFAASLREGARKLFLAGANGEPRPRVRPQQEKCST